MVAAHDLGVDIGGENIIAKALRDYEIVKSPSGVILSCAEAVGPPGVLDLIGMKIAEAIGEACRQKLGHLAALLIGEACVADIRLGVFDIYFVVRDVEVTRVNYRLFLIEGAEICAHIILKFHTVIYALEAVLGVGNISRYEVKLLELKGDNSSLVGVLALHAVGDGERLFLRKNGSTRVALALCGKPV